MLQDGGRIGAVFATERPDLKCYTATNFLYSTTAVIECLASGQTVSNQFEGIFSRSPRPAQIVLSQSRGSIPRPLGEIGSQTSVQLSLTKQSGKAPSSQLVTVEP